MFTVKRAAELTGVSPATLRAWEQRYGVAAPARTEAGYRLYDDAAVARIRAMKAMVDAGWSAREAAARLDEDGLRADAGHAGSPDPGTLETSSAQVPGAQAVDPVTSPFHPGSPFHAATETLVRAALDMEGAGIEQSLDRIFGSAALEEVLDTWLMPFLREVGDRWAAGRLGVATEHVLSAAVQRRLATALADVGQPPPGAPRVVVGLPRGSRHELGALACAAALRRAGADVVHAGSDLPASAWVDAVARHGADAALVAVPTPDDVVAARDTVDVLAATEACRVFVGGGAAARLDRPVAVLLDQAPAAAAAMLLEGLGGGAVRTA